MKKPVCSVCRVEKPKLIKTPEGLVIMCDKCLLLGVQANQEAVISGTKVSAVNVCEPDTFRNKPATCTLFLYSYFKIHYKSTMH